jgi:3-phosphoshikimate 1-carboxyvinyltransferase
LPASKSISNRVLLLNALSKSPYPIENLSDSDDTQVMRQAFESESSFIDIGAAGTSMRFLTAYLAQLPGEYTITGTERMKNRPIRILVDALRSLGAEITYLEKEGYPPLKIKGKSLKGGTIRLDGSVSSQYISALLMIAPNLEQGLNLYLENKIISRPYLEMTIRLMEYFGIVFRREDAIIRIEPQTYKAKPFKVESDWSAASYWYEIMALSNGNASVELLGLEENSMQGDSVVSKLFERLGVATEFTSPGTISLRAKPDRDSVFHHDFINEPDLAQTVAVTCCMRDIPFHFEGLQSLRIKETDRITALQQEMRKLGYVINSPSDSEIAWIGEKCPEESDPIISTYEDHRMAMAFAPVCLKRNTIKIREPQVVGKSYPGFWNDLKQAEFKIIRN